MNLIKLKDTTESEETTPRMGEGLPWWSSGQNSTLPTQGSWGQGTRPCMPQLDQCSQIDT